VNRGDLPPDLPDDDSWRDEISSTSRIKTPKPPPKSPPASRAPLRVVTEPETRPDILLVPDVHLVTDAMVRVLVDDPEVYARAGALVHVIRAQSDDPSVTPGTPVIREMPVSYATDRISLGARCVRRVKDKNGARHSVHVSPPRANVVAALERGMWASSRELRGVLEAPAMRADGSIIQEPGFDRASRYLYEPNASFIPVADRPSHSDAVAAYACLCEPFAEFPYVSGAHRSAVVAAILTLLARPAIDGAAPSWVFDASARRSGKSLQVDVIHLIATGRSASRMTFPEQDEELEKVLSSYALRGASSINFDNVARKFGGAALDKVATAVGEVDLRVLGSTDIRTVDWRAVIFASGNNVSFRGDMIARVLSPRIESPLDRPETLDPRIKDLRAWTLARRPELVHAALTLLRAYVVAGRPEQSCPRWGGFEAWARLIPHALVWLGADDPMAARRGLDGDYDPDELAHAGLVSGWAWLCERLARPEGLTIKQALAELYPGRRDEGPPDGFDDLRELIEDMTDARPGFPPSGKKLGERLRKWRNRVVNGRYLSGSGLSGGALRWTVRR